MKLWHSQMHLRIFILLISLIATKVFCYSKVPVQYHIQTDKGPDRYFRYQTLDGQYRREKRFEDGRVIGTYGWVDPNGLLRLFDYIADDQGYRIVRKRIIPVEKNSLPSPNQTIKKTINHIAKPKLRPLPANNNRRPSSVVALHKSRQNYKSARQRLKDQQGYTSVQKPTSVPYTSNQRIRTRVQKPSPLKGGHNTRRRFPSRRVNQLRTTTVAPTKPISSKTNQAANSNPTFLTNNVPPDLGYDAPGGKVTIDFDLGVQYRKEKQFPGGVVVGEHGYVDPLGILRRTYYRSDSNGKKEFKRSYWVGTRNPGS